MSNNCNTVAFETAKKKKNGEGKISHRNQNAEEITSASLLKREVLSRRSTRWLDYSFVNDKVETELNMGRGMCVCTCERSDETPRRI